MEKFFVIGKYDTREEAEIIGNYLEEHHNIPWCIDKIEGD